VAAPSPSRAWSRLSRLVATAAIVVVTATGCTDEGRSRESEALVPYGPGDLAGTEWLLVATGDHDGVPARATATLRVGDGEATGTGPCNRYRVPFEQDGTDGEDVTTGPVVATQQACPGLERAERRFFQALEIVDTAALESDALVLSGPRDTRLVFERAEDAADAVEGEWHVVSVATEDALVSVLPGTEPRLDFSDDGTVGIQPGCNVATAQWQGRGRRGLSITAPGATLKACEEPAGVMEQEAAILVALERTARVDGAGDALVLLDADDTTTLVLERAS
jgi:heat shock protein HslJ